MCITHTHRKSRRDDYSYFKFLFSSCHARKGKVTGVLRHRGKKVFPLANNTIILTDIKKKINFPQTQLEAG